MAKVTVDEGFAGQGATPDLGNERAAPTDGLWAPQHRRLTVGLVLTITLVAFEALAISTVMPVVEDDLGGLQLYGWVFSGFFLASLLGTVVAGTMADKRGTALPFAIGLALFAVGLLAGGFATSMGLLVAARVAQGLGAGAIPAVAYASVGRAYPPALRPRVFAVFSSAWVIPGLIGPAAASAIAEAASWRLVFLAILPFVAIAAVILLPTLTRRSAAEVAAAGEVEELDGAGSWPRGLLLTVAVGAVLVAVSGVPMVLGLPLLAVGAPLAVRTFATLVPDGTLRLRAGMPAAVLVRGMLTFAFFGTDAYVSLALQEVRDQPTWVAGAALTACTLCWTAAAWVQERQIHRVGPRRLVAIGLAIVAASIALMYGVLGPMPIAVAVLVWGVSGFGIGLAYSPLSVVVLGLAEPGREGARAASLQLSDLLGVALGTGTVGAIVAFGDSHDWAPRSSLELAFTITLTVAVLGVAAARRLPDRLPT